MFGGECGRRVVPTVFGLLVLFVVVTNIEAQPAPDYAALLAAADRSDADRQADKRRDPAPFLAFAGVRPGMKVLDMGAGGGYSTELIARAVAPAGVVYGQNPADLPEKPKATFEARLKTPAMKDVVADIRPFDDPVPPDVHDLDLITFLFFYHDTTYMNVDRIRNGSQAVCGAEAGRLFVDRRSLCITGTRNFSRQNLASHRGKHVATRSRSGRLPPCRRRRFLAQPSRHA